MRLLTHGSLLLLLLRLLLRLTPWHLALHRHLWSSLLQSDLLGVSPHLTWCLRSHHVTTTRCHQGPGLTLNWAHELSLSLTRTHLTHRPVLLLLLLSLLLVQQVLDDERLLLGKQNQ